MTGDFKQGYSLSLFLSEPILRSSGLGCFSAGQTNHWPLREKEAEPWLASSYEKTEEREGTDVVTVVAASDTNVIAQLCDSGVSSSQRREFRRPALPSGCNPEDSLSALLFKRRATDRHLSQHHTKAPHGVCVRVCGRTKGTN